MNQLTRSRVPPPFSQSAALATLKQLTPRTRLDLDAQTYVLRAEDRYIAYRHWMAVVPIVEVFPLGEELPLVRWLDRFGYPFEWSAAMSKRVSEYTPLA